MPARDPKNLNYYIFSYLMKDDNGGSWIWNNGAAIDYENRASSGKVGYNFFHFYILCTSTSSNDRL